MQKKIIELFGIAIKFLIRYWAKQENVSSDNYLDIEEFALNCGLEYIDANKFQGSINTFSIEMAEGFMQNIKVETIEEERKNEIINQIKSDLEKVNLSQETIVKKMLTVDELGQSIMNQSVEKRKQWEEKEEGIYNNCVRYLVKCIIDFSMKLPSFTPAALKVIIQRQEEYQKELGNIISEIRTVRDIVKSTEITYREYESIYREKIIEKYSKVELIGSGISDRSVRRYDISSAYVELSCTEEEEDEEIELSEVFSKSSIVWIKGEAGSGKTTFLKWVAICASKNNACIENIRNTIPIVLELRSINYPISLQGAVNEFSSSFGYTCPNGWLIDVLKKKRGIILIDGLDEIEQGKRQVTFDFIEDLVENYPEIKILVTARNSVEYELNCEVSHYEITPMKMTNIKKFIKYWHRSVLHIDAIEQDERIKLLQKNLVNKIVSSTSLKMLARNPLLCAMICALNYVHNEYLPENRMDLYEKCCEMLIDARDTQRGIRSDEYREIIKLDYSHKRRILEELAYWMLRNGQSSEKRYKVEGYLDSKLKNSNLIQTNAGNKICDSKTLLNYLIERSGIIREPEEGRIDFVHKTFMEFLAVKAICRECDFGILVREACNVNWKETIIMCFHEMSERYASEILKELVDKGKRENNEKYILLASLGATNAIFKNDDVKKEIDLQIEKMIPPKKKNIAELAQAGEYILPFLYNKSDFSNTERERCLDLLSYMEIDEIIPNLISYVEGEGNEKIKLYAVNILSTYYETVLDEYNVKEQLFNCMLSWIENGRLTIFESLMNIINNVVISEKDKKLMESVTMLTIICGLDEYCNFKECMGVYNNFRNLQEITLLGEIDNIAFIEEINNLTELNIITDDASAIVSQLQDISSLKSVKRLSINAEWIVYFCENDIKQMKDLEYLKFCCNAPILELDFNSLDKWSKLRKIVLMVNEDVFDEMRETISYWRKIYPMC